MRLNDRLKRLFQVFKCFIDFMTKIYIFKMGSSTLMLLDVVDSFANAELESNPHYIEIVNGKPRNFFIFCV